MIHRTFSHIKKARRAIFIVMALTLTLSLPAGAAERAKGFHTLNIDPAMKAKVGEKTIADVTMFFEDAEAAISKGDLEKLLSLYSENYRNEDHVKAGAREIWKRIFDNFSAMATMHNMKLVNYSPEGNIIVIGCSGLLLGKKKGEEELVTIDTWTNEEHILTLEGGKWRLIGSSGFKRKRLWFDKPMHPLF
jgi:predicted SnoaL-like aldol condensation-catalyzing enzyme